MSILDDIENISDEEYNCEDYNDYELPMYAHIGEVFTIRDQYTKELITYELTESGWVEV